MQMINFKCCSPRNNLGFFQCMVVMSPRNLLEKDKGDILKFGTNLRDSIRNSGIPESNYFAWISPVIYGSLSKQKSFWQCSSRLTGHRLKPIQRWFLPFFPHYSSKWASPALDLSWGLRLCHVSCLVKCSVLHRFDQNLHLKVGKKESFEGNIVTGSETFQWQIQHLVFHCCLHWEYFIGAAASCHHFRGDLGVVCDRSDKSSPSKPFREEVCKGGSLWATLVL